MLKVLIVSYTPRITSNTRHLMNAAVEELRKRAELCHMDLAQTPPPLLSPAILNALLKRNFLSETLTAAEQAVVKQANEFLDQVLAADRIIVAFPMYNFSLPATVKAWVDVIVQKDKAFAIDSSGQYYGLLQNKAALILMTSGSDFEDPVMAPMNHSAPLLQQTFAFIGISSHTIAAYGLDQYANRAESLIEEAQASITHFLRMDSAWNDL